MDLINESVEVLDKFTHTDDLPDAKGFKAPQVGYGFWLTYEWEAMPGILVGFKSEDSKIRYEVAVENADIVNVLTDIPATTDNVNAIINSSRVRGALKKLSDTLEDSLEHPAGEIVNVALGNYQRGLVLDAVENVRGRIGDPRKFARNLTR